MLQQKVVDSVRLDKKGPYVMINAFEPCPVRAWQKSKGDVRLEVDVEATARWLGLQNVSQEFLKTWSTPLVKSSQRRRQCFQDGEL